MAKTVQSKISIGLNDKQRQAVVAVLKKLLADEIVLYMKTRSFHWNTVGIHFAQMHALFEEQYEALDEIFDDIAERIRALGEFAPGTMADFLQHTRLSEKNNGLKNAQEQLAVLLSDHESVICNLRDDIEIVGKQTDVGTEDFLTGLLEQHEKTAWMLRAHLG